MEITEKQESKKNIDFSKYNVNISAQFIVNYRNILDASISRGTWKGNELTQIGGIYQNLNNMIDNIVNQVSAQVNEANEEANEETKEAAQEA